jgi:hypothetical protein
LQALDRSGVATTGKKVDKYDIRQHTLKLDIVELVEIVISVLQFV